MKKLIVILMLYCLISPVWATEAKLENIQADTNLSALERGVDALMDNCHSCHSLKYIKYRDLVQFGIAQQKIDAWRGGQPLDAPLVSLMSDDAAMQSFGLLPPDLSLMTKAREGGASYVYSYLIGYYLTPEGMPGNHIFPETKMPDALGISGTTDSVQRAALQGKARDVVSFLAWAADPHGEERHKLGYYVIGYLIILTLLLYFVKNQVWSRLK
jgi:ubiquinol-cytochrome c reductase cytochrome c1 subunit